jgi:hypothetical protein
MSGVAGLSVGQLQWKVKCEDKTGAAQRPQKRSENGSEEDGGAGVHKKRKAQKSCESGFSLTAASLDFSAEDPLFSLFHVKEHSKARTHDIVLGELLIHTRHTEFELSRHDDGLAADVAVTAQKLRVIQHVVIIDVDLGVAQVGDDVKLFTVERIAPHRRGQIAQIGCGDLAPEPLANEIASEIYGISERQSGHP